MVTIPVTGIEPVDRVLKQRAPFDSAENAEELAAKLLQRWRALQPNAKDANVALEHWLRRRRKEPRLKTPARAINQVTHRNESLP
jgi:hypothetical protein